MKNFTLCDKRLSIITLCLFLNACTTPSRSISLQQLSDNYDGYIAQYNNELDALSLKSRQRIKQEYLANPSQTHDILVLSGGGALGAFGAGFLKGWRVSRELVAIQDAVSDQALCRELPKGVTPETHVGKPYKITDWIEDGSKINLGNRIIEVIHVPGHTPDAIALIDRQAGLMWTGDTYYPDDIWLYVPETNLTDYEKSLQKLVDEIPSLKSLLPAHISTLVDPKVLLDVQESFKRMINGEIESTNMGGGTVKYIPPGDKNFTFIMRDEPLPYTNYPPPLTAQARRIIEP